MSSTMTSTMTSTTTPTRTTTRTTQDARFDTSAVVDLAEAVDRDGLDAHTATLSALAGRAAESGVSPVLLDVMLGTDEPYVARVRAFVRVGAAVARSRRAPSVVGSLLAA